MSNSDPQLLIIWHSRTGASREMARSAKAGAEAKARLVEVSQVEPTDLLSAAGYLFVGPENLASLSGEMKAMFDRAYYPLLGKVEGRAYATIIAAGSDGEGAQRQIDRIATGWRLKRVAGPMIVRFDAQTPNAIMAPKVVPDLISSQCKDLGAALAEGLHIGLF